jgi:hypothetical protein
MATEGATLLHGGHPIVQRIEEKLRSSLKIEHFVSFRPASCCSSLEVAQVYVGKADLS